MKVLGFIYRSRGAMNFARRAAQVFTRFGPGPGRMGKRFDRFIELLGKFDCRPSFPITALPMSRHPDFARHLLEGGAELAVHSYTHVDLTTLDYEKQSQHIGKAVHLFRSLGIPYSGFRAPYLRWNEDTMRVVEAYQFRYSSNQAVLWDVLELESLEPRQRTGWEKAREFYDPLHAENVPVLPYKRRGFVEIPISLPDDEILLDRMYLRDPAILATVWEGILERTYKRGELFTVQLHPERIDFFREPLEDLLFSCRRRNPGVWVATLAEIADWWDDKSRNSVQFIRDGSATRAILKVCPRTSVYLKEGGEERRVDPGELTVESDKRPCAGVGAGTDRKAMQMLRDRGFIVEVGEEAGDFTIHLGDLSSAHYENIKGALARLEEFPGPLVRFGTWPDGKRSALAITGDIDALTIWDFLNRLRGA